MDILKKTTFISVPKKRKVASLNEYALTSTVIKCSERLIMTQINSNLLGSLDPLQFVYLRNKSTAYAISLILLSSLEHLVFKYIYIRLLIVEHRSTFNATIKTKLISKLPDLGVNAPPLQLNPRLPDPIDHNQ